MKIIKKYFAAVNAAALILTGCKGDSKTETQYPLLQIDDLKIWIPEASILFYSYGKNIEKENSKIADILWNSVVDEKNNTSYSVYIKQSVFYDELINMCSLASMYEKEYSLLEEENQTIKKNAADYINMLDDKDIAILDISLENIENLFRIYTEAKNMEKIIIDNWNGTVSEEEYRVCLVRKLVFKDYNSSIKFYEQYTSTNGEEYDMSLCLSEKILNVDKSADITSNILEEIFKLKTGQLSTVLSEDNEIVIYEMQNVYDNDLSEQRKNSIIDSMKTDSWKQECNKYLISAQTFYNYEAWDELEFSNDNMFSDKLLRLFDYLK